MRISDWSSDVCSSDLVIKRAIKRSIQQRLGVVDSDQYLSFASTVVVIDEAGSSGNFGVWHHRQQLIRHARVAEIGRESCRERVCPSVYLSVVAVSLTQTKNQTYHITNS